MLFALVACVVVIVSDCNWINYRAQLQQFYSCLTFASRVCVERCSWFSKVSCIRSHLLL